MRLSNLVAASGGLATTATALQAIQAVGNKLFNKDGSQFFIKGIAYQLTENDPLLDSNQCERDAKLMKTLGVNTIRVYHVDGNAGADEHKACMKQFADAGIYVLLDMDTFSTYILPEHPHWNQTMLSSYSKVMDVFARFDNTLGFFVGNEIIAKKEQSLAAPYIKAAARDLKAYRDSKNYRKIPVGYSAADIAELRPMLQDYLTCGGNASENIDFFALNSYEWCGESTYKGSGYSTLQSQAKNFPVPIFFSETGCNTPKPRTFEDQKTIFSSEMVNDWSGSIIYEWIQEANDYGLISYGPKADATMTKDGVAGGYSRSGTPTPVSPDFNNLKSVWANIKPTGVSSSDYNPKGVSSRTCPSSTKGGWLVDGNVALPTVGETLTGTSFSSSPSATGNGASASSTGNAGSASKKIAGMGAGLTGVMMIFTFWF